MAWTATVNRDADQDDVGSATLTWDLGGPDEFVYSDRVKLTPAKRDVFIAEAQVARDFYLAKSTSEVALTANLQNAANAAEGG
jgi:hypothetical protein